MEKNDSSKTILIIVAVIAGILLIAGIIGGFSLFYLYKIGASQSPTPTQTKSSATSQRVPYQNSRYGFALEYPQTFSKQESQNGDGVTLTSSSPAITIRAYGSPNSQSQTLDEYLNTVRTNLFQEVGNAEEIAATNATLGGLPAQERRWQYLDSVSGNQTITDQVTALKGDSFYTLELVIGFSDYSQYAPMFDEILTSFQFE